MIFPRLHTRVEFDSSSREAERAVLSIQRLSTAAKTVEVYRDGQWNFETISKADWQGV